MIEKGPKELKLRRIGDVGNNQGDRRTTDIDEGRAKKKSSKRWKKVLYEDLGYPDNYVDKSFLEEMKKNRKNFIITEI